ncbi:MAG TPA: TonB-dependent receptor [Terriglobales bacterium]|nr:TonB-dependent receptor [Terriglobales bacterium]
MRFSRVFATVLICVLAASAAEITIKVIDPQSAAVSGAQVTLWRPGVPARQNAGSPLAMENTSAEGIAVFHNLPQGSYRVQVLAPGFAAQMIDVPPSAELITVGLELAPAAETVVVTATGNPVPSEVSGAQVETVSGEELETTQPIAADDAVRFLPGAVVNTAGQRGGLSSLFVRGGDSRYNKVIVDGVSITEPGGTFDFGTLPLDQADRLEFLRGTESTLYGSDAMTSVVRVWTRTGSTPTPELRFGADAGNYGTENGYASLAGVYRRFDYNVFGTQFNTLGSGPNDDYSNSLEGVNTGVNLSQDIALRLRARHDHSVTGVQGEWNFNGDPLLSPDLDQRARQNNTLASLELTVAGPSGWTHRFTGFEFNLQTANIDSVTDPNRVTPFGEVDTPFQAFVNINRAGFDYQGNYVERNWAQTTLGYEFEDENGTVNDPIPAPATVGHGLRLNDAAYVQQALTLDRLTVIAGARFVHNTTFGNTGVPRVALGFQALKGGSVLAGTRLNFSYATGIKEARFEEAFANGPFQIPNPNLKAERNRAFEAGVQQAFYSRKFLLIADYFNNLFHDQITFITINPNTFLGQYINLGKSLAHGAEVELQSKLSSNLLWNAAYVYTSTQILAAPPGTPSPFAVGDPLLRRPKHSATTSLSYLSHRWGADLEGGFVGRRPDSDFFGFNIDHAAGYVLVDAGGWYALTSRITAYANIGNLLDRHYNEVVGYPALGTNFRAGMRFRIGGE